MYMREVLGKLRQSTRRCIGFLGRKEPRTLKLGNKMIDLSFAMAGVFTFSLLLSFMAGSIFLKPHGSNAVTGLGLVEPPTIALDVSSNSVNLEITPTPSGTLVSGSHLLSVSTNMPIGYNLSLSTTSLSGGITPITGTIVSPIALTNNTWGYALTNSGAVGVTNGFDASYATPTPSAASKWANPTSNQVIKKTTAPVTGDTADVYYGAKVNTAVPAGTYVNVVSYSATSNVPDPIPSPQIQSISPTTGDSAGGDTITITGRGFTLNDRSITTAVKIGGSNCTNVQIASNTPIVGQDTVTCKIPARNIQTKSETVDVDVSTWYGNPKLAESYTYTKEYFSFKVDTRMTDTLDNASDHFSGNATSFSVPASSVTSYNYDWLVDCGVEGQALGRFTGASSASDNGYTCNYPVAGAYTITIIPANHTSNGWMNAFGFGDAGATGLANSQANRNLFLSIETPFPTKSRGMHYAAFSNTFRGAKNAIGIPANLFQNVRFSSGAAHYAFRSAFQEFGYNSTTMTLPDNLFGAFLGTPATTTLTYTFGATFMNAAYNSKNATIPAGLFSGVISNNVTDFRFTFAETFRGYGYASTVAQIPASLFSSINTSSGEQFRRMFQATFQNYGRNNIAGTGIPSGLFATINTSGAQGAGNALMNGMFFQTFNYAFYSSTNTSLTIPANLFQNIHTAGVEDLSYLYSSAFDRYGYKAPRLTIPSGLFGALDMSSATNINMMFKMTFYNCGYSSTVGAIPSNLLSNINTSSATSLDSVFYSTFESYAYATTIPNTDINDIWGSAVLTGVTAANAGGDTPGGVFFRTFYNSRNIAGNAQTFINNKLGGIVPTLNAGTFYGSTISDIASLAGNWKTNT